MDPILEQQPKTIADVKAMLKHLETEHRKANISEKTYKELKAKYKSEMQYMANDLTVDDTKKPAPKPPEKKEEPKAEVKTESKAPAAPEEPKAQATAEAPQAESTAPAASTPEEPAPPAPEPQAPAAQPAPAEDKKGGLFSKLFHKKEEEQAPDPNAPIGIVPGSTSPAPAAPADEEPQEKKESSGGGDSAATIEIEKLKVMLDVMREQKTALDETIRTVFENIGEIRSMSIQNDATASEINTKVAKIDDEIGQVRPKEIDKKFRDLNDKLEKFDATIEKMQTKTNDMSERINKAYELLRGIGGIENLVKINDDVQQKLADIKEATHYIERLGSKSERIFIDLKAGMDELVVYKAKQESVEESIKDLSKNIEGVAGKLESLVTKKDLEAQMSTVGLMQKEIDNINKSLAVVQANVPEPILKLRKQRDDIALFLDSLEAQRKANKIGIEDYDEIKEKNEEKLRKIETALEKEWKKLEDVTAEKNQAVIQAEIKKEEEALKIKPQEFVITQTHPEDKSKEKKTPSFAVQAQEEYVDFLRGNKVGVEYLLPEEKKEEEEQATEQQQTEVVKAAAQSSQDAQSVQIQQRAEQEQQQAQAAAEQGQKEKKEKKGFLKMLHKEKKPKEDKDAKKEEAPTAA